MVVVRGTHTISLPLSKGLFGLRKEGGRVEESKVELAKNMLILG